MTVLFMATADFQSIRQMPYTWYDARITNSYARTGSYSFDLDDNGSAIGAPITATTSGYIRVAIKSLTTTAVELFNSENIAHISLVVTSTTASFRLGRYYFGSIASTSIDMSDGNFHVFEFYWNIADVSGRLILKMDGVEIINYTGDTKNGGTTANISCFIIGCRTNGGRAYVDDIIVLDDKWPGLGGIYVLKPNAGSSTENWTASTGDPENCVDDQPPSFTDYISTNGHTLNTKHLFGFESLPIVPGEINGVGIVGILKTDNTAEVNARSLLKSGTTTEVGSSIAIANTETLVNAFYSQNPDTLADWVNSDINSLEAGVETQ